MPQPTEAELAIHTAEVRRLLAALNGVLFGQERLVELVVTGILARGHILLEGLPGLGKTELVKGLAKALELGTKRIQFTPDLLPGDITGNPVLQESNGRREFVFQPGPLFTNLCLADEMNWASPKTQSALLEAMQERRVTVLGETHPLPQPFFVLATQNPIELEGTYPLPEAQLDRFLIKLDVQRNDAATLERIVTHRELGVEPELKPVMSREALIGVMEAVRTIYLPDVVANYIARLVDGTHPGQSKAAGAIKYGASPRAALESGFGGESARPHGGPDQRFVRRRPGRGHPGAATPHHSRLQRPDRRQDQRRRGQRTRGGGAGPGAFRPENPQGIQSRRHRVRFPIPLLLLGLLALLRPLPASAEFEIFKRDVDQFTGTEVRATTPFERVPNRGFMPVKVTIHNDYPQERTWTVTFCSAAGVWTWREPLSSSYTVTTPGLSETEHAYLVPMATKADLSVEGQTATDRAVADSWRKGLTRACPMCELACRRLQQGLRPG